jgi:DNA-binding NarL/FixJ family response regulator
MHEPVYADPRSCLCSNSPQLPVEAVMTSVAPIQVQVAHRDAFARAALASALRCIAGFIVCDDRIEGTSHVGGSVIVADAEAAMAIARALSDEAAARIIIVPATDREWDLKQALRQGVRGYLVSGFAIDELAACVRAVHRGTRFLCARAAARLAESLSFASLTEREGEVLRCVVEGLSNKEIARELDVAAGTVKSHLHAIFDKLGVASRTQAIAVATRRGMLGPAEDCSARRASARHLLPRPTPSLRVAHAPGLSMFAKGGASVGDLLPPAVDRALQIYPGAWQFGARFKQ